MSLRAQVSSTIVAGDRCEVQPGAGSGRAQADAVPRHQGAPRPLCGRNMVQVFISISTPGSGFCDCALGVLYAVYARGKYEGCTESQRMLEPAESEGNEAARAALVCKLYNG